MKRNLAFQCIFFCLMVLLVWCPLSHAEIITGNDSGLVEDEEATGFIPIGFTFSYWGKDYTQCSISTNGWMSLKYTATEIYENNIFHFPLTDYPSQTAHIDGCLAPFFTDLDLIIKNDPDQPKGKIYYYQLGATPGSRQFIVQYNDMAFSGFDEPLGTFQVILFEGSNIIKYQYRYLTIKDPKNEGTSRGGNAMIGIDEPDSNGYIQYLYHEPKLDAPLAISFTPVESSPDNYTYVMNENAEYLWIDISGLTREPPEDQGQYSQSDLLFSWNAEADASEYTAYTIAYQLDVAKGSPLVSHIIKSYTSITSGSFAYSYSLEEGQIYYARIAISLNGGKSYQNMSAFSDGIIYDTQPPDVYTPIAQSGSQDNEVIFTFNGHDAYKISSYHIQIDIEPSFFNPIVDTSQNTLSESTEITYAYMAASGIKLYARAYAIDGANNQSLYSVTSEPFLIPLISQVSPYTSTITGQTTVVISGTNFGDTQGNVLFGTSEVTLISSWSMDSIVVKSPPRNPGVVDITVLTHNGQKEIQTSAHEYFPMLNWTTSTQEFDESANSVTITATLDQVSEKNVLFSYTLSGSATSEDYSLIQGQMTILASNMSVSKTFQLVDDNQTEPDETLVIQMFNQINALAGSTTSQTITIKDNDAIINADPESITVTSTSGATSFSVSNTGSGDLIWNAISNHPWVTIIQGASGTNDGIIQAQFDSNTGEARTGSISITSTQATNSPKLIYINQAKPESQKPTISTISDIITNEDQVAGPFTFTVSDSAYTASLLSVSASSSNTSLLANENITLSGVSDNRNITVNPKPNENGTTIIQLIVKNPEDLTSSTSFMLTVTAINDPPLISDISDQVINEDQSLAPLVFTVSDLESEASTLTLTWEASNINLIETITLTGTSENRAISITPKPNQAGTSVIVLTVSDPDNLTATSSFTLTVTQINDPPIISSIADQALTEDTVSNPINFTITDVESIALTVVAFSSNQALIPDNRITIQGNGTNRSLIISPIEDQTGQSTIQLIVSDADGLTATTSFVCDVQGVNDPPSISTIENQTIDEDQTAGPLVFTVSDAESDPSELTLTWEATNINLVNILLSGTAENRTITIETKPDQAGTTTITLTVFDPKNLTASTSFMLTVTPVNDPPEISTIPGQTIHEDSTFSTIELNSYVSDIDSFEFAWSTSGQNNLSVSIENGIASITINNENWNGSENILFTVTDPGGLTASRLVEFIVSPVNDAPVISDIPDQIINEGESFTTISLDDFIDDVDNDDSEILWRFSGNQGLVVSISNRIAIIAITNVNWNGTETITFIASDPEGLTATDSAAFTVIPVNDPPVLSVIPGQTIDEDTAFENISLTPYVTDVDDTEFAWSTSGQNNLSVSIENSIASITINSENWHGTENILFTVSDPGGLTDSQIVNFKVDSINDRPIISDIPDQTIDEGKSFTNIFLDDFIEDVDHADAEIFWTTSGSQYLSVTITNRIASISIPNENWNGTEVITFIASDPYTFTADSAAFTVTSVNDPPVAQNQTVSTLEDVSIAITLAATDIDSTALTYEIITPTSSGNISGTPPQLLYSPDENWSGTDQLVFQVNDGEYKSNEATVGIQVQAVNDPPTVESETFDLTEDTKFIATLKASDPENDALTLHIVSSVQHGTLEIMNESNLEFQYTPEKNYVGTDAFEVKVNDGKTDSQAAVISLNILEINDPPVLADTQFSTLEDHIKSYTLLAFDQDSGSLSYSLVEQAVKGTVSLNQQTGSLTYTPLPDENGNDLFTVIAKDEDSQSPMASVSVWITPVNDPPTISDIDDQTISEDTTSHIIELTVNDIESSNLSVSVYSTNQSVIPDNRLSVEGTGSNQNLIISPIENQTGETTILLTVSDDEGLTAQTQLMLVITESSNILPETPLIVSDVNHIDNTSGTIKLRANPFHDPDENEHPLQTLCRIGRVDRLNEYEIEETNTYAYLLNNGFQEYPLNIEQLKSGLKYYWQIAYTHSGGQTSWSSQHTFLVGEIEPVEKPDIPVGQTQNRLEMISFTHFFPDSTGSAVLQDTLGADYDTTNYRIGTYDPTYESGGYREYDNDIFSIEPGRAYWFLSRNHVTLDVYGVSVNKETDIDIELLYNIQSDNGWNMIACPNDADYYWDDLQVLYYENEQLVSGPISIFDSHNQFIDKTIWQWQDGAYDDYKEDDYNNGIKFLLKRNKGYWVYCLSPGVYLRFPEGKGFTKRRIQTTDTDWFQSNSLIRKVYAEDSHTPPPPMNAFGLIQIDPEVSNCFIDILNSQSSTIASCLLFFLFALLAAYYRHVKTMGILIIAFMSLNASSGLTSESPLKIEPGRAFFDMGIFALEDGMYEVAKNNFTKALDKAPNNPYYLQYAGKTHLKLEKYVNAQKLLDRAWSINPKIHGLKFDRAYLYLKIKEYQKAIPLFVEIADDSPENVLAVYLAGVSYFKNEQYVRAVHYLIQAAERSPNIKPNAFFYAGIARIKAGQIKNGLKLLKYVQTNEDEHTKKLASQWIKVIEKMKKGQNPFSARLNLGYKYDSNVQIEPDDMNIYSNENDSAAIFNAIFKYTTRLNDQWHFSMGHRQYLMKYQSLDDYDLMQMSPFLSIQYRRFPFTLAFKYKPCTDMVNNASYLTKHRFNTIIKQKIWDEIDLIFSYEYSTEEYDIFPLNDGHRNDFMMKLKYPVSKRIIFSSSMTYKDKHASHAASNYCLIQGEMSLSVNTPMDIKIELTSKHHRKTYDFSDPVYGAKRIDKRLNTGFSLIKQINRNVSVSLGGIFLYNDSNVNVFDYHRQISLVTMHFSL